MYADECNKDGLCIRTPIFFPNMNFKQDNFINMTV